MIKKIFSLFTVSVFTLLLLSTPALAASQVSIGIAAGYSKGNNSYDVVVQEAPNTKLVLYVNDKNVSKATVNKKSWATFRKVKLTNVGKISFTKEYKGKDHKTYQRPINYVRYYKAVNDKVDFVKSDPTKQPTIAPAPAAPAPTPVAKPAPAPVAAPTPAPAPAPVLNCTNGTYVNTAGNTVCRPEASVTVPAGATAQCVDGTYSFSQSRSGTCSHHGGVSRWL